MNPRTVIELMKTAENLKNNTRHSWTSSGRQESVAEHSWRLALLALFLEDEFPELDMNKVIRMCLVHDMGEAFTGDIPAFQKTEEHEEKEAQCVDQWIGDLPEPYEKQMAELFEEMEALQTGEARLYKALDKLETLMQHNEADLSTWLPLEYELNLTYGKEQMNFSGYIKELRREIDADTIDKIQNH